MRSANPLDAMHRKYTSLRRVNVAESTCSFIVQTIIQMRHRRIAIAHAGVSLDVDRKMKVWKGREDAEVCGRHFSCSAPFALKLVR
jgi:hypothetical protein